MHPDQSHANAHLVIDLDRVRENIQLLRAHLPEQTRMMIMLKASAYGTDDLLMSEFLQSCAIDIIGVAHVEEGVRLREAGVEQAIFVTAAPPSEASRIVKLGLEVGVSDLAFAEALNCEAKFLRRQVKVHLHVNTGMGRFGCSPCDFPTIAQQVDALHYQQIEGVMSHFACAEDPQLDPFTKKQIALFDEALSTLDALNIYPRWKHLANSAGALRFSLPQCNMVRIGLAIYGTHLSNATEKHLPLKPAVTLTTQIMALQHLPPHSPVGYGRRYTTGEDAATIAILPIGYFDGLHRQHSAKHHVLIREKLAPMVGTICMDHVMVDVTHIPKARVGDSVIIFGVTPDENHLSVEDFARKGATIPHEVMACLGPRIQRLFVTGGQSIRHPRFTNFSPSHYATSMTL